MNKSNRQAVAAEHAINAALSPGELREALEDIKTPCWGGSMPSWEEFVIDGFSEVWEELPDAMKLAVYIHAKAAHESTRSRSDRSG